MNISNGFKPRNVDVPEYVPHYVTMRSSTIGLLRTYSLLLQVQLLAVCSRPLQKAHMGLKFRQATLWASNRC